MWAAMEMPDLAEAREALRKREDIPENNAAKHIRAWTTGDAAPPLLVGMPEWAESRDIDSVVWTALPPKFDNTNGRVPTIDEVVLYLSGLTGEVRDRAERYIRFAPKQIDTAYRRKIESTLQWTAHEPHA
jgi:hypothetical protein